MTALPLLLGLPAVGTAIGLGVYLVADHKTSTAAAPAMSGSGMLPGKPVADPTEVSTLLRRLGAVAAKVTPADYAKRVQRRLDLAGNPRSWTPERLLAFKGLGLVVGLVFGFFIGAKHGLGPAVLLTAGIGAAGLFVPDVLIKNLGEKRQIEMQKGLPDAMDMLTVCVEAGMGFDAALARVARNLTGPFAEECARVLQEMQFGLSRTAALRALVGRTDVAELRGFVSAMVQSGELGISIGDVLREQAKEMRQKRRQRAEEKAQKLQVKLLMPLVVCLLPAMFIVILGPAIMNMVKFFGKGA